MKVLVIGAHGQLGTHLLQKIPSATGWGREHIDWVQPEGAKARIVEYGPTHIINASAYTAVDRAEEEPSLAWSVNVEGPRQIALAAQELDIPLIHISTDYIFDGSSPGNYGVTDPVNPINVYGLTKLAGEIAVRTHCTNYWIIRTSWVFSEIGNNFVKTMLRLGSEHQELSVVDDQFGRPTFAGDLASVLSKVLHAKSGSLPWGTYHMSGGPACSWFDFAEHIFRQAGLLGLLSVTPNVKPIKTSDYPTTAIRPLRTVLAASPELESIDGFTPDWKRGLTEVIQKLERNH